jgi:hypothetical protein
MKGMRRTLASLLLTLFSLPLLAPALASIPDASQLPACCRRNGKHHCAMNMEVGNIPPGSSIVSEKCPYSPFGHSPFLQPHAFAPIGTLSSFGRATGPLSAVRAAETGYRISADRTRQKRGPPRTLAL